jgi:hypothetical protein
LRQIERPVPLEAAPSEHFKPGFDQFGMIEAAQLHKDESRKGFQVAGEKPGSAFRAEIPLKSLSGIGSVTERLGRTTQHSEASFENSKKRRHLATGRPLAVKAMTIGDKIWISVEFKFHCAAGALASILFRHNGIPSNCVTDAGRVEFGVHITQPRELPGREHRRKQLAAYDFC